MALKSKLSKVVSYIQDNKSWERIYVLLKILFPCLRVLCLSDSNKAVMEKVFYYSRMTKISIIKSSYDLDNKEQLIFQLLDGCYVLLHTVAKMQKIIQIVITGNRSTMLSKHYFLEHMKRKWL